MIYLLLICSIILAVVKSSLINTYSKQQPDKNSRIFFFNLIAYSLAGVLQLLFAGLPRFSLWTILPAAGYALACYLMQLFLMKSMAIGSMSLSSLFCMYGMLIPTVAGPLFFGESFSFWKVIGVILMIVAVFFSTDIKREDSKSEKKWLFFALLTLIFSGLVGVFEKVHQTGPDKAEISSFLSFAFIMIGLFNGITLPIVKAKENAPLSPSKGLIIAILTGLIVVFYCRVNLILSGSLDTMIYYPVANGGAVLLTILVSIGIFREPLKKNHIFCFIFGTAAILLLGIG